MDPRIQTVLSVILNFNFESSKLCTVCIVLGTYTAQIGSSRRKLLKAMGRNAPQLRLENGIGKQISAWTGLIFFSKILYYMLAHRYLSKMTFLAESGIILCSSLLQRIAVLLWKEYRGIFKETCGCATVFQRAQGTYGKENNINHFTIQSFEYRISTIVVFLEMLGKCGQSCLHKGVNHLIEETATIPRVRYYEVEPFGVCRIL